MSTLDYKTIKELAKDGKLITNNYSEERVRESCYEARTSNDFFEVVDNKAKKIKILDNDYFVLRPNNQVVCVTKEYFEIPLDIIARILLTGHYFVLGIAPINTYADPGFKGRLGIVLTNTSKNYLKIKPNEKIAKIEFSRLDRANPCEYVGQHGGDVDVWPYREEYVMTEEELTQKAIIIDSDAELSKVYGSKIASIFNHLLLTNKKIDSTLEDIELTKNNIKKTRKWYIIFASINAMLPILVFWGISEKWNLTSPALASLLGVLTGLIANIIFMIIQNRKDA